MKFDIIMLTTLFVSAMFLVGGTVGVVAYNKNPYTVISEAANEKIYNLSLATAEKCTFEDRSALVMCEFKKFLSIMMYQSFAAGMEFGFTNPWIGELMFSIPSTWYGNAALVLVLIYFLTDNLSIILIPIALGIIAKDWIGERFGSQRTQSNSKTS